MKNLFRAALLCLLLGVIAPSAPSSAAPAVHKMAAKMLTCPATGDSDKIIGTYSGDWPAQQVFLRCGTWNASTETGSGWRKIRAKHGDDIGFFYGLGCKYTQEEVFEAIVRRTISNPAGADAQFNPNNNTWTIRRNIDFDRCGTTAPVTYGSVLVIGSNNNNIITWYKS